MLILLLSILAVDLMTFAFCWIMLSSVPSVFLLLVFEVRRRRRRRRRITTSVISFTHVPSHSPQTVFCSVSRDRSNDHQVRHPSD
jgi:hypothetical protein